MDTGQAPVSASMRLSAFSEQVHFLLLPVVNGVFMAGEIVR